MCEGGNRALPQYGKIALPRSIDAGLWRYVNDDIWITAMAEGNNVRKPKSDNETVGHCCMTICRQ